MRALVGIIALVVVLAPGLARAACSNSMKGVPGVAGEIEYFSTNEFKYCDGTSWVLMTEACTSAQPHCGGNPNERVVYLHTAMSTSVHLVGLLGLDSACTREAYINNGIRGIFYAWHADKDAANDPVNRFEHSTVPYVRPDGTKVADDWNDLVDCTGSCLDAKIYQLADGTYEAVGGVDKVFTNVKTDGSAYSYNAADNCDGWGAVTGAPHGGTIHTTGAIWTDNGTGGFCSNSGYVYCFEQQGSGIAALLKHADSSNATSLADVRTVVISGGYAFVASNGQKSFSSVDFSDPTASLTVVNTYIDATNLTAPRDIAISGNYAYVASSGSNSLTILDISNPTSITLAGALVDATNLAGAQGVAVSSPYAYVVSSANDTFTVVNINNPAAPSVSGSLTDSTNMDGPRGVKVSGSYAYVVAELSDTFLVIDVSTPASPVIANSGGAKITNSIYLNGVADLDIGGGFAYVVSTIGSGASTMSVINIANPLAPKIVADISHTNAYITGLQSVARSGRYFFAGAAGDNRIVSYEVITNYALGDSCSTAGEMYYDNARSQMVWCNGSKLVPMSFSGGAFGGCVSPAGVAGQMKYDSGTQTLRFCDGAGWVKVGK